ncbi:MAG TPA: hypothetical protein VGM06_07915 [Polyangiaceae bacterium]|jgi:hypothetical protein
MAIDRIGPKGPPIPPPAASGPSRPNEAASPFEAAAPAPTVGATAPSDALQRLRGGDIDLRQYLDQKVEEATAHLSHLVTPAELEAVRAQVRDRLGSDPTLVDLVRNATGSVPEPPADS